MPDVRMENGRRPGDVPDDDDVGTAAGGRPPGNGSAIAGLGLILAGATLLSIGASSATPTAVPPAASTPLSVATVQVQLPCADSAAARPLAPGPAGNASTKGSAAAAPSAAPAGAEAGAPQLVIRFVKKEVIPQKEDIAKLAALGAKLARRDGVKIVLEGYGDDAGTDEGSKGLGRRRGTVLKRTLGDVGVSAERVTVTPIDVAGAADAAGTVRLRTIPALPEGELK